MKTNKILSLATAAALTLASSSAFAVATIGAGTNSGAAGTTVTIPVTYNRPAGDAFNVFSATFRFAHNNPPITFVSFAAGAGPASSATTCNANGANNLVTCVLTTNPPTAIAVGNYTLGTITYQIAAGAAAGAQTLTTTVVECTDINGDAIPGACSAANGTITVQGAPTPVGPSIAYNPAAGAAAGTGGPVNFTGVTTVGSTGAGQIVATPSGGSVAGTTTTVGNFTLTGADAANFAVTSAATLTFNQGTNTPQNITMTCTSGAAARTANLQATETITGGATSQRFWVLSCPAGAAGAVPPTITYAPTFGGPAINVAAGSATVIQVGCPTDGSPCNGSGTGLPATSRLEGLNAVYNGPMFSPLPTMVCAFITEAGAVTGSPLDFVALGADSGDIRCTCPANTTGLPSEQFIVSVNERIPASSGAITATRNFTITCGGPPPVCPPPTYVNQAPNSTINLINGGAAQQVTSVSLVGASAGVNQTISCATSNVTAGSTFTVTTSPTPLVVSTTPALGGTVSASCTNSETTAGTATLTCVGASQTPNCASTTVFTLSCPGQGVPPPTGPDFIAVPTLSEQGRILLAALVLLLGLGVVGFRMRG